jgi:hypothetical protein
MAGFDGQAALMVRFDNSLIFVNIPGSGLSESENGVAGG